MKITLSSSMVRMVIFLCLLALTVPAIAQDNTLEIKCIGPDGQPLSGFKVFAIPLTGAKLKETKSEKGVALFKKLDNGVYRILARQQGFAPAFAEFFALQGKSKQSAALHFQAGDPQSKLYFEDQAVNQKAFQLLDEGVKLLQAGKFAEGEKPIRESLQIYPANPDSNYNLAIALLQQKKFDETIAPLKQTIEISKILQKITQRGQQAGGENPYAARAKDAQFILDKLPSFKLRSEGEKLAQERKFDEAIAKYKEVLEKEPDDADILYNISLAHANAKRYEEAMKAAEKAIQLKPQEKDYQELKKKIADIQANEVILKAKGILEAGDKLYQTEDFTGALKKYEEALPMIPEKNQPIVLTQIGRTYGRLKQSDKAIENFKKAIEMAPEVPDHAKALAQFYLNEKRYEEALNVYVDPRAAGNTPPDQVLFNLGQTLSKQGNSEVAELAWEKALKINPNNAEAGYEYGMALYFSKKNDKLAKEILNRYLQLGKDPARMDNVRSVLVVINKRTP